ncbi:hypothetical protein LTR09_000671 [Extremus antarcticus]|uniref:NAD binding Rossmann fold oxidoreductase n=1 Tax=Extremus antarcticus TaxID=702011 RepID=A0AAJ0GK19_9PEZI|nr:hypothetical protein LTR09_000671 [Extremus antarcticus]
MAPINVAVIGYGLSAKVFHIPLILALPDDFKLYGIVQRSPKPDDDAQKDHPGTKAWRSVEEVYSDPDVDLVVITSIPSTHFQMCSDALNSGKHVLVEKPFVPTAAEADKLCQIQHQSGKLLSVYQNRRWDADFLTLRELVSSDRLGDIAEFETHFDRHRPDAPADSWKVVDEPGHGAIYELGTHLIDQVYHLFGMPQRVTGFVYLQRHGVKSGSHDACTVLLHYDDRRMIATVKAGVVSPEVEQLRFWVKGTKGGFKKFHLDVQEDQLKDGLRPGEEGFGEEPESHHGTLTVIEDGKPSRATHRTAAPATYVKYYRVFAKALRGEGEVPTTPGDARDVLRIIELAIQSSKEGRTLSVV